MKVEKNGFWSLDVEVKRGWVKNFEIWKLKKIGLRILKYESWEKINFEFYNMEGWERWFWFLKYENWCLMNFDFKN